MIYNQTIITSLKGHINNVVNRYNIWCTFEYNNDFVENIQDFSEFEKMIERYNYKDWNKKYSNNDFLPTMKQTEEFIIKNPMAKELFSKLLGEDIFTTIYNNISNKLNKSDIITFEERYLD